LDTKQENAKTAFARFLELPESTIAGGLHIELQSNKEAIVEGCRGVLEYGEGIIRLAGNGIVIKFSGRALEIGGLDRSAITVRGNILSIEFIS
jgi:sporulation protein YqfC